MPDSGGQQRRERHLPHLEFAGRAVQQSYTHPRRGGGSAFAKMQRDPVAHAAALRGQLDQAKQDYAQQDWFSNASHQTADHGLLLNIESEPGFELQVQSLEKLASGILLLNVRRRTNARGLRFIEAAVFVPYGKLHILENQIASYAKNPAQGQARRHERLLANIRHIRLAAFEALWTE